MRDTFYAIGKVIMFAVLLLVLWGLILFVCENIFGVTPHLTFTPYKK